MYSENGAKDSSETSQSLGLYGEQRAELISKCLAGCGVSSVRSGEAAGCFPGFLTITVTRASCVSKTSHMVSSCGCVVYVPSVPLCC